MASSLYPQDLQEPASKLRLRSEWQKDALPAFFDRLSIGLVVLDASLRVVCVNRTAAALASTDEPQIGRALRDAMPDLAPVIEPRAARVLESGNDVLEHDVARNTERLASVRLCYLSIHWDEARAVAVVIHDAGEPRLIQVALQQQTDFEALLVTVSEQLIESRARPESLRSALRELSRFHKLTRIAIVRFSEGALVELAHESGALADLHTVARNRERENRWLGSALAQGLGETDVVAEPEREADGDRHEPLAVAIPVVAQDAYALICYPASGGALPERSVNQLRSFARVAATVLSMNRRDAAPALESKAMRTVAGRRGVPLRQLISASELLDGVLEKVGAVANTNVTVLIQGESGVGKELIARAIHERSGRAALPLVTVNCASVPRELFESEFFGHVRGAFTGAHCDRVGRFELADNGTLFLDEVAEIPVELQSKLLRVLQEREFEPLGSHRTRSVDVRVVAATNRDLEAEVQAGRFRQDLYYRLSVFPIRVPPLRERPEDIPALARHFVNVHSLALRREGLEITDDHLRVLLSYDWPGNVRELNNVIERAVIESVRPPLRIDVLAHGKGPSRVRRAVSSPPFLTAAELRDRERENITAALMKSGWRVSGKGGAAELLGMRPSTLRDRLQALGIRRP